MNTTYNISNINTIAKNVLEHMNTKTLLLYGEMGTGKTTLVKAMIKRLGGGEIASSPTFSIVNEYSITNGIVYHFDLYRLKDITEAYDIGIEDYLISGHYCFIEWPEVIEPLLINNSDTIKLNINPDNSRSLKLNYTMNLTN